MAKSFHERSRTTRALPLCGLAALAISLACTQNLGRFATPFFSKPAQNENVGLGFDPGLDLSGGGISGSTSSVGAVIPGPTGMPDRRLAFLGFASAIGADLLERDPATPTDGNGGNDIFVSAVLDARETIDGTLRPSIFGQAIINVFRHPRCVTCHSFHYAGGFGAPGNMHPGGNSSNSNQDCETCHDADIGSSKFGEEIVWEAPLAPPNGPDISLLDGALQPKSVATLCNQTKVHTPDPVTHFANDDKIFWAFESTLSPQGETVGDGPVQFERETFDDLVEAWVQGGCRCETSEAVLDVALASRASAGNATANGASSAPSLAFLHNPGFDPDNAAGTNPAGWVLIGFQSAATNLVAGVTDANGASDVFRAQVAVNMDEDGNGVPLVGAVNLVAEPVNSVLVSAANGTPTVAANGSSSGASISADGDLIAFTSVASDLGFTRDPGNGGADIAYRNITTQLTALVSLAPGAKGGNGPSGSPSISSDGLAVAFTSVADDLDFNDTNGVQDVYWARMDPATTTNAGVFRASVATGGVEATGGASSAPSIFVLDAASNDVLVTFESQKTDLVGAVAGLPATNVYLYRGPLGVQTTLASQISTATSAELPDGSSSAPTLSPDGSWLAFESDAANLDTVWPDDENGTTDVLLLDLADWLATGDVSPRRLSIAAEGVDGLSASNDALLTGFRTAAGGFDPMPVASYRTAAENLGAADNSDQNIVFLAN